MAKDQGATETIGRYIAAAPAAVRGRLRQMRAAVKAAAPGAREAIRYGIPTLDLSGHLVHFAAFRGHIGFYPTSSGIKAFKNELAG